MAVIAAIGLLMAGSIKAIAYVSAYARYEKAATRYKAQERFFDEGRITLKRAFQASHELMEAESALCLTTAGEVAVISDHVDRSVSMFKREVDAARNSCRGYWVAEDEGSDPQVVFDVARSRLKRLTGSSEARAPE